MVRRKSLLSIQYSINRYCLLISIDNWNFKFICKINLWPGEDIADSMCSRCLSIFTSCGNEVAIFPHACNTKLGVFPSLKVERENISDGTSNPGVQCLNSIERSRLCPKQLQDKTSQVQPDDSQKCDCFDWTGKTWASECTSEVQYTSKIGPKSDKKQVLNWHQKVVPLTN